MLDPLASDRPLIVYIDHKSPYAYIAVAPTYALAEALGIAIDWRPLTLDIPSYLGSAKLDARGAVAESQRSATQWTQVKYAYRDARRYASLSGLTVRGTTKIWDTRLSGQAMLFAKAHGDALLRRFNGIVFERFWKRELDVEDRGVIDAVLREAGADPAEFRPDRDAYDEMQRQIFEAGIFGVPGYVVEGEYYWGREHLPRIRWILGGRRGPAPDVAYERIS